MRRRGVIAWKSNGSLLWTTPLTLIVAVPGIVMITIAVVVSSYRDFGSSGIFLGITGGVLVFVAVGCWIESSIFTRDEDLAFPSGLVEASGDRRRVSVRRANGAMYYATAFIFPLFPAVIILTSLDTADYGPPDEPVTLGLLMVGFGCLVWLVMAGLTARFVVTPTEFRIDTLLRTVRVPRHLVGTFEPRNTEIRLTCNDNAGRIYIRVDSPIADWFQRGASYRHNRRTQVCAAEKIQRALAAVPADPSSEGVITRRWRPFIVSVTALLATAIVTGAVIVTASVGSLPSGS